MSCEQIRIRQKDNNESYATLCKLWILATNEKTRQSNDATKKLDEILIKLNQIERRLDKIDQKLVSVNIHIDNLETKIKNKLIALDKALNSKGHLDVI